MEIERIIYAMPFLLGGLIGVFFAIRDSIKYRIMFSAKNYYIIEGTIVEIKKAQNTRYNVTTPIVEFSYKGTIYKKYLSIGNLRMRYNVGDNVSIVYFPDSNNSFVKTKEGYSTLKDLTILIISFFLLILSVIILFFE